MQLTIGMTGMDPATESALRSAFGEANARLGGQWALVPETEASHVVVDMDSMYGPMSWLRLHGAGKSVIGLTSAPRVQTDFRLPRPVDSEHLIAVLQEIAPGTVAAPQPAAVAAPTPAAPTAAQAPVVAVAAPAAAPSRPLEAPAAVTAPTVAAPVVAPASPAPPAATPAPAAASVPSMSMPPTSTAFTSTAATSGSRRLVDWLVSGDVVGRLRIEHAGETVLVDADQRQYHGPAALKPLSALVAAELPRSAFAPIDEAQWQRQSAALGGAQPLSRLLWFSALLAGRGTLAAGFDPAARYQLGKWPQTEREFPKHFRIATAMMKAPATLPEIAEASGVPLEEVTDFVNANLATGFAEPWRAASPEPEPPKSGGGLFGRLRGR